MKMSLLRKLLFGFIGTSLLTATIAAAGIYSIYTLEKNFKEISNTGIPALIDIFQMETKFNKITTEIKSITHPMNSNETIKQFLNSITSLRISYNSNFKNYEQRQKTETEQKLWNDFKNTLESGKEKNNKIISLANNIIAASPNVRTGIFRELYDYAITGEGGDSLRAITESLSKIVKYDVQHYSIEKLNKIENMVDTIKKTILILSVSGILFSLGLGVYFGLSISKQIKKITNHLTLSSNEVAAAASQITKASLQLSESSREQAASVEEMSATMEEMSSQSQSNADSSKYAENSMKTVSEKVSKNADFTSVAAKISEHTKAAAETGNRVIEEIVDSIEEIKKSSEKITDIIDTINEIAQQTKMLAVNAAIEAARAGEHGQGFAVVADQVSKLAETSKSAAKEISELIKESGRRASAGNETAKKGTASIKEILESSIKISDTINNISNSSAEAAKLTDDAQKQIENISKGAVEQSGAITQASSAIRDIDKITIRNSAAAEETSAASEELKSQALSLIEIVDSLNELVNGTLKINNKKVAVSSGKKNNLSSIQIKNQRSQSAPSTGGNSSDSDKSSFNQTSYNELNDLKSSIKQADSLSEFVKY